MKENDPITEKQTVTSFLNEQQFSAIVTPLPFSP